MSRDPGEAASHPQQCIFTGYTGLVKQEARLALAMGGDGGEKQSICKTQSPKPVQSHLSRLLGPGMQLLLHQSSLRL